jgi:hypothetical protein
MGLGQSMITVLFFALLTIMFLNAISLLNNADTELLTVAAYKTATDLGQSLMAEILTKKFDAASDPTVAQTSLLIFTAPASLGPSAAETFALPDVAPFKSIKNYSDVDDYNNYSRLTDSTNGLGRFRDTVLVYYIKMTNPPTQPVPPSVQWTKQIEVWVTNDQYMSNKDSRGNIISSKWVKFYSIVTNLRKG